MKSTYDYTPVLKQKIEQMIEDLKPLTIAQHAIRELRIVINQLNVYENKKETQEIQTSQHIRT